MRRSILLIAALLACAGPETPEGAAKPVPSPSAPLANSVPARIPLTVRETAGVARSAEVVRSGVPLPRSLGVRDLNGLAVVGPEGRPVPAELHVLARWNAGRDDASAPVQWLLAVFPATVAARGSAVYTLVVGGAAGPNPAPASPLRLTRKGDRVVVDTGAAVFRLGGGALLDGIELPGGTHPVTGGSASLRAAGAEGELAASRGVRIESAGPLSAVVVVEGAYGLPPVGKGGFGSRRRYVFTAGSPTVVVRQSVAWEGDLACTGCVKTPEGKPNGVLVERARDALAIDLGGPAAVTAVGSFQEPLHHCVQRIGFTW